MSLKPASIFRTLPLLFVGLLGIGVCTLVACVGGDDDSDGMSEGQLYGYGYGYGYRR